MEEIKEDLKPKEKVESQKNKSEKKKYKLIAIIVIVVAIIALIGVLVYEFAIKARPEDEYETIAHQDGAYIQYHFNFDDVVDYAKEYKIKDYKICFNFAQEEMPSFSFNENEKLQTLAREYDVYYLKDTKLTIITAYGDFATKMYCGNSEGLKDVSDVIKGAFALKDFKVENNILTFNVARYSQDNYIVVTDDNMFSAYNYTEYVNDDYPVELSYKYDLSNTEFSSEQFKIEPIKTIKELSDSIQETQIKETGNEKIDSLIDELDAISQNDNVNEYITEEEIIAQNIVE